MESPIVISKQQSLSSDEEAKSFPLNKLSSYEATLRDHVSVDGRGGLGPTEGPRLSQLTTRILLSATAGDNRGRMVAVEHALEEEQPVVQGVVA